MAESANPSANTPADAPAPPPPATPARKTAGPKVMDHAGRMVSITVHLFLGAFLILLSILLRKGNIGLPHAVQVPLLNLLPHYPYLIGGIGVFLWARARGMAADFYTAEKKKDRHSPHAWKIPLIWAQAVFLYLLFIYAMVIGLNWGTPIENPMALAFFVFFFFIYVLVYVFEHARNRIPSIAGLRMAVVTLSLAALSALLWVGFQMVFPSLLLAFLALIGLFTSLFIRIKNVEQVGFWPKILFLVLSALLLAHVAWYSLPFGRDSYDYVSLNRAAQALSGEIPSLTYFQPGVHHEGTQLALTHRSEGNWTLELMNPDNLPQPILIPAGSDDFRSLFAMNGKYILADMVKDGTRAVWKVDTQTGKASRLQASGIEPFSDGVPWSERNGQLLYVTHSEEGKYLLKSLTLATNKSTLLMSASNPILTPSWVNVADPQRTPFWARYDEQVAYADGANGLFYVLDLRTMEKKPLKSDLERMEGEKFKPLGKVLEVVPSPDSFRYAYMTQDGNKTILWVVGSDGKKRDSLYETTAAISHLAWHPDSQRLIFQELHQGWHSWDMGFLRAYSNIKILDANQGGTVNLIPPQISHSAPAVSPDGVKVAFVAGDGLWYPTNQLGIWIANLR
ncbi:MAG TPA: WD40 repeat domain-containing protein [bacterium]|nr:WD40 repeat domain-containing protein [bacterium]